jgi:hypothetical protein
MYPKHKTGLLKEEERNLKIAGKKETLKNLLVNKFRVKYRVNSDK